MQTLSVTLYGLDCFNPYCLFILTPDDNSIVQVQEAIEASRAELLERRYTFPVGKLMGECTSCYIAEFAAYLNIGPILLVKDFLLYAVPCPCTLQLFDLLSSAGAVKDQLKWADGKLVKSTIEQQVANHFFLAAFYMQLIYVLIGWSFAWPENCWRLKTIKRKSMFKML